ncbi:MAG TPA: hypothetical protein VMW81_01180 [Nitrospinota bacterium]|nr:hypothetical protein [Nitrospinota bacterium]
MKTIISFFLIYIFSLQGSALAFPKYQKVSASPVLTAEKIYKNTINAYKEIESYSYTNYQGEYTWFNKEKMDRAKDNYDSLIDRYGNESHNGFLNDFNGLSSSEKNSFTSSKFKKGVYGYKFLKPFIVKMVLLESDYLPAILHKSILEYRPDKDPKKFMFLPRGSSAFSITRSIYDESGSFLTMNWTVDLLMMHLQHENGTLGLAEKEKVDGRDCYVLEFSFKKDREPFMIKQNLKSHGIPIDINAKVYTSLFNLAKKNFSKVKYWVDDGKFIVIKKEEYINDKLYSSKEYRNIKINNLSLKDF